MSIKGTNTTSDYIDFLKASSVGDKFLKESKNRTIGLYIIVSINTGLRISDLLSLRFEDMRSETIKLVEKKTKKNRQIKINDNVRRSLQYFESGATGYLFMSQKGCPYTIQSMNRRLKEAFKKEAKTLNISSHSLRKSFGRKVFENNGESEKALTYLSELFNHSNQSVTRQYLGIRQQELNDIYDGLA